eukprot:TRINITY_DN3996_c0_g2_i1.p1 TRINITY_DN3996_c0_g2~~TRINITY_DN3996_c0_g2_i1.p1  ORF type:complete len:352 (+),score=59.05 TRINITY_DN3996_c0_g2_i1:55-1056(+)
MASAVNIAVAAFLAVPLVRSSRRAKVDGALLIDAPFGLPQGDHKCTITWPGKPGAPDSVVSFGVSSCPVKCLATNADHRYTEMFAHAFRPVQHQKACSCEFRSNGDEALRIVGECPADAPLVCLNDYLKLATHDYIQEFEKNSARTVPRAERYHERTFNYSCLENGCKDGDCDVAVVPDLWSTLGEQEKHTVAKLVRQAAKKEVKLTRDQKHVLETMGKQELHQAAALAIADEAFSQQSDLARRLKELEEGEDDGQGSFSPSTDNMLEAFESLKDENGSLTVAALKAAYKQALSWNGLTSVISVDHMAQVAKLVDSSHEVTFEEFQAFVKPSC